MKKSIKMIEGLDSFLTLNCVYGEVKISSEEISIRVIRGLAIFDEKIREIFPDKSASEFGDCDLVFKNPRRLVIQVVPYIAMPDGSPNWFEKKVQDYSWEKTGDFVVYGVEGTLNFPSYCPAFVDIECDAEFCELHV